MLRLTKRMEDGSYQANNNPELPGENSYQYKNMIIDRCGRLEDLLGIIVCNIMEGTDLRNLKIKLYDELKKNDFI